MKRHVVLTNMKEMFFAIFCCVLLALLTTPAGAQVSDQGICNGALVSTDSGPMLGYAIGCGAVITVTAVDANGNATAYTVTIPNNTGESPGNGNPYDGEDDTLIGILNNSSGYLTSITLNSPDTTFGGIFNFDEDGPCDYLGTGFDCYNDGAPAPEGTTFEEDPLDYEGPDNTFTVGPPISCTTTESGLCYTSGTINFVTPATPSGIPNASSCDQPCNSTWFALEQTPSSLQFVGPLVPTPPNGTAAVISAPNAPITTSITLPPNTTDGDVAYLEDVQTPYPPATYNALFFPPACTPATTSNGKCKGTANTFSGGSIVPASVECFAMNGACIDELIECFNSSQTRVRCDTNGIVPPAGTKIALTMQFITPTAFHNPAMLIASDCFSLGNCPAAPRDWANITDTPFQPGDTCTRPPCKGGGGTGSLNSELVMADLNLRCQVLNFSLFPTSGGPGTKVTVTGSLNGCKSVVPGETTLFGKFLTAQLIFTFNGPTGSSCTPESVSSPAHRLVVPLYASLPFQFQLKVPPNACPGTTEVTSSILSGTVSYVNAVTFTVP